MQLAEAFRGSAPQPNVGLRHAQSCRGKKHQGDCPDHWWVRRPALDQRQSPG